MGGTTGDAAATGSPLSAASDQILVERAVDGDATAFGEIVRRHSSLMRAYVSRIVGSLSEADDVVQDAFTTAWKQLPSLRDGSAVRAWLMRIASREAFARLRRRTADVPIEDVPLVQSAHPDPEVRAVRQAQLAALSAALDELPEDQRRAWLLREVADLSYAEIAEEMTTSASTVRGLLSRARSSIAIRMEDWR
ncbi:RNA polymerase sigma factor [Microbacterium aurantiacum]|uniref:RNA polymerase sigma 70 n=1 Tax=Microbacterium aurantiacum TaxID=162393 RepID=A0A0M8MJU8_9MICO|nr:RNA polymerase sigma factor [Microbacterium chocolatum]ANG84510.1 RNA polymerase subunit sigma-70 [Microbacterium chocolatum]KOS11567.1 RNA polymerase sigma 70 [Microbacterium chocolatum]